MALLKNIQWTFDDPNAIIQKVDLGNNQAITITGVGTDGALTIEGSVSEGALPAIQAELEKEMGRTGIELSLEGK